MMNLRKNVLLTLLTMSGLAFNAVAQDKTIDQIVAVVGGNVILKSDVENMYLQKQAQGITTDGDMKCEILEDMLIEKLLVAEAELDTNIVVTDNDVNQQLDMRMNYFVQNLGSNEKVEEYFNKPLMQIKSELNDVIRNEILSQQMRMTIIQNVTVTPSEVRYYYKNLPDSEKEKIGTQYEYAKIAITPKVSPEEEQRIKDRLRSFKKSVEEEGANFGTLAVLYSQDGTATNGGELGYQGRGAYVKEFSQAAFNLEPGQVSNVVKTEFGYHLIQMIDSRGELANFRHILLKPKVDTEVIEQTATLLDSVVTEIRKESLSYEEAAYRFSTDKNTKNTGGLVVNPATLSSRFTVAELDPAVSKKITSLSVGEISEPFITVDEETHSDVIQVIKVLEKVDAHKASIKDDYYIISEDFLVKKKETAVRDWVGKQQSDTYIRIDPTYANCEFEFKNWVK